MKDRIFIDTNILIYYTGKEFAKQKIARNIIYSENELFVSTQVINEFINVCYKKLKLDSYKINNIIVLLRKIIYIKMISEDTIINAIRLKNIYNYSYYDSLILASALENECEIIYSEDFQNSQQIESKLRIINPYIL